MYDDSFLDFKSFCWTETPLYDRQPVFFAFSKLFDIENTVLEEKAPTQLKSGKSLFFFRDMQISRILFNKPQFYCQTDISEVCHLHPILWSS